jgi:DNA helicase-2/ATP-dependent DNA helicase PcrA
LPAAALASGADISDYAPEYLAAIRSYEQDLHDAGLVDFEAIVIEALSIVAKFPRVRELLTARYPWVAVDEYQDLGGPLHQIVLELHRAGTNVFAVGDGDQSLFGFTGAHPEFLGHLAQREGFREIRLRFNYRAGRTLITASQAALAAHRDYEPDPERPDASDIFFEHVPGGLHDQTEHVATTLIPQLTSAGVPEHEIAVIYRGKGILLDAVTAALTSAAIPFVVDKDARLPQGEVVGWSQRCAAWTLGQRETGNRFRDLLVPFVRWSADAGVDDTTAAERLFAALDQRTDPGTPIGDLLTRLEVAGVGTALRGASRYADEADAWMSLLAPTDHELAGMTVGEYAHGARPAGKVAVTNFHNAKGRQFDAVILPGLQTGLMPYASWSTYERCFRRAVPSEVQEGRRLFYVGSRERRTACSSSGPTITRRHGEASFHRAPLPSSGRCGLACARRGPRRLKAVLTASAPTTRRRGTRRAEVPFRGNRHSGGPRRGSAG